MTPIERAGDGFTAESASQQIQHLHPRQDLFDIRSAQDGVLAWSKRLGRHHTHEAAWFGCRGRLDHVVGRNRDVAVALERDSEIAIVFLLAWPEPYHDDVIERRGHEEDRALLGEPVVHSAARDDEKERRAAARM